MTLEYLNLQVGSGLPRKYKGCLVKITRDRILDFYYVREPLWLRGKGRENKHKTAKLFRVHSPVWENFPRLGSEDKIFWLI
jgi:hypothetical protein